MCYLRPIRFKQGCQLLTYGSPSLPTQGQWIFFPSPLSSCCSLSQLRNLLASPGYQSSLVLGKNRCARPSVTPPSSRLSVILELRAIVWFNNICYRSAQVRRFREGLQCEKSASEASLPRSLSPNHWIKINKTNPVTVKNAEIYHTPFYT